MPFGEVLASVRRRRSVTQPRLAAQRLPGAGRLRLASLDRYECANNYGYRFPSLRISCLSRIVELRISNFVESFCAFLLRKSLDAAAPWSTVPSMAMDRQPLGETGLSVSRLGLGLAALGRPGYINLGHAQDLAHRYEVTEMRTRAHVVLDAAWAAGIRYFDVARSYGRAEEFLSTWLSSRRIAPDAVTVGSKWGYTYTAGWRVDAASHEVKEHPSRCCAARSRRVAGCSAATCSSIRSTRRPSRAACSPTRRCMERWRSCAPAACGSA